MRKILVTGALGQIGAELVPELRERHGADNVIASGWRRRDVASVVDGGPFEIVDCTKPGDIAAVVEKYEIGTIYHMPAFLSVLGEEKPEDAWALNLGGYANALEVARRHGCKVFFPEFHRRLRGRARRCRTRRRTRSSGRTRSTASPRSRASCSATTTTRASGWTRAGSDCLA